MKEHRCTYGECGPDGCWRRYHKPIEQPKTDQSSLQKYGLLIAMVVGLMWMHNDKKVEGAKLEPTVTYTFDVYKHGRENEFDTFELFVTVIDSKLPNGQIRALIGRSNGDGYEHQEAFGESLSFSELVAKEKVPEPMATELIEAFRRKFPNRDQRPRPAQR